MPALNSKTVAAAIGLVVLISVCGVAFASGRVDRGVRHVDDTSLHRISTWGSCDIVEACSEWSGCSFLAICPGREQAKQ